MNKFMWTLLVSILLFGISAHGSEASVDRAIQLVPDLPSPQTVGTKTTWTVTHGGLDFLDFRFGVWRLEDGYKLMYDLGKKTVFQWTPMDEGYYLVILSVGYQGWLLGNLWVPYFVGPRVTTDPQVTATDRPLVALYSAPPCAPGDMMKVVFSMASGGMQLSTDWKSCDEGYSINFFVAGMLENTTYKMNHVVVDQETYALVEQGPELQHTTGGIDVFLPEVTVVELPVYQPSYDEPVTIFANTSLGLGQDILPTATDIYGRVLWYYGDPTTDLSNFTTLTRILDGGTMLIHFLTSEGQYYLREIDLAGNTVKETTSDRLNVQLQAMGEDMIGAVHHDAVRLPNGQTLTLAHVERLLPGVQDPVIDDVLGDMIIALDRHWQVIWTWNSFDHLDVHRKAILDNKCFASIGVCPDLQLATVANDWTHSNSIGYSPADGNLILCMRHQDWVIKIDYQDGAGSGDVIWRLGPDGDFTLVPDDPELWFTSAHDARYIGENQIILYDNGMTRCEGEGTYIEGCHSRGQVLEIDEVGLFATLVVNIDLGNYSEAMGSCQKLSGGNYNFTSGYQPVPMSYPDRFGTSDEFLPDGTLGYSLETNNWVYRSYKLMNLYTAP